MVGKISTGLFLLSLIASLFTFDLAFALENLRVAYPSMNTSVFCLTIAQKEGYLKEDRHGFPGQTRLGFDRPT